MIYIFHLSNVLLCLVTDVIILLIIILMYPFVHRGIVFYNKYLKNNNHHYIDMNLLITYILNS